MNDNRTDDGGAKAVIVLQPVTDTINAALRTALRTAGYQPDVITPDCVVYVRTNQGDLGADRTDGRLARSRRGAVGGGVGPQRLLLTPDEAAAVLSIGRTKLYQLMKDGVVASVLIGGSRRIPSDALTRLVAELDRTGCPTLDDRSGPRPAGPEFMEGGHHVAVAGGD
jgi:excisionase family DNA binding protein